MLNFFGVLARGADCTDVHLSRLIGGVKRAGLGVHDISLAMGSADVLGNEVSRVNVSCTGTAKRIARIRSVVSSRRIGGGAMELVNGHESFLALSSRGALSILDASFECVRASWFQLSHDQLCGSSKEHLEESDVLFAVVGVFAGWMSVCVRMYWKGFSFAVREGCRELVSEVGRVSVCIGLAWLDRHFWMDRR